MVLAIASLAMLLLYQLISKRILYNIPIGEKIFLFQNDYAYISYEQVRIHFQHLHHKNIFINNINHLILNL